MKLLDLFSGIGGVSLAAHTLGMRTAAFCECEAYPVRVLNRHFPEVPVFPDVKELTADALADANSIRFDQPSEASVQQRQLGRCEPRSKSALTITAGFPCQDLSYAGKGAGLAGERSGLYGEIIRLVRDLQPEWVLLENVNAILTRGVGTVLGELAACGYGWAYGCVPACAVGAPHRRDRWWAVAWPTLGDEADRRRGERIWSSVLRSVTPFGDLSDGWPTATASDAWAGDYNRSQVIPCNGRLLTGKAGLSLGQAARGETWPTATSCDWKGACASEVAAGGNGRLPNVVEVARGLAPSGSLNPDWVDALMGYPVGYTFPEGEAMDYLPGVWPAGLGAPQHEWEPPRLTDIREHRAARLKALGNSIVPAVASLWLRAIQEEAR